MHLVLRQVQVPQILVVRDQHFHDAVLGIAVLLGDEGTKLARPSAAAGRCELEPDRKPIAGGIGAMIKPHPESDGKGSDIHDGCRMEFAIQRWEVLEGPGHRHVLIAQLCEAVVAGYEEIVAGDMVVLAERRPVTLHRQGQHIPLLLRERIKRPPCLQRTKMHGLRLHLAQGARELRMRPLLPVADAIPVIERDITH